MKQTGLLAGSTLFFLSSLIIFIARFATSIIVARTLGTEGKGIYTLVLTIASMLVVILDFGLASALTYLVANGQYRPYQILNYALWTSLTIGSLGGALFYLFYTGFLSQNLLSGVSTTYIIWVLVFLPVNILASLFSAIILGLQNILAYNLVNITRAVFNFIFQLVSAFRGFGLTGAILSWLIANLIAFLLVLWFLRKEIKPTLSHHRSLLKSSFDYGVKSYPANLLTLFTYRLDTFIVNFFSGAASVGLYSTGVSSAELLWYIPNSISSTLFPKSATMDKEVSARLTARVCRQTLLITVPISIVFGVIGCILIPLLYGKDFQRSIIPFIILLPGIIGMTLSKIIYANLSGSGKPQYATFTSVITFIITIALDLLLIPIYDIAGAAIASSIAYLLGSAMSVYWFSQETAIKYSTVTVPTINDISDLWKRASDIWWKIRTRNELS